MTLWSDTLFPLFRRAKEPRTEIEIQTYDQYDRKYQQLAIALGRPDKKPQADEVRLIRRLIDRRAPVNGSLTLADTLFLASFTSILSPARVIEIGTGIGFSSAVMAAMLHCGQSNQGNLDTIDAHTCYRQDESVPIGGQIEALIPEFARAVQIHAPHESDFVDQLAKPNELKLGFIDADHQHPCPLLDLLRLARVIRPGGWIVLHDIALGTLALAAKRRGAPLPFAGQFGAEWLFQNWPFPKMDGGNIGAVQVPRDKRKIRRVARKLLKLRFEVCRESDRRLRREIQAASRRLTVSNER